MDGYVEADASVDAVWQEKRVKDSKTGSIISLQELEELLMARVLAQVLPVNTHSMGAATCS